MEKRAAGKSLTLSRCMNVASVCGDHMHTAWKCGPPRSLRDDRWRCFDWRRGLALADVYAILNVAPESRVSANRSEIVIGLSLIEITRIEGNAVGRAQFSMIVVSDMNTATRPAFVGSLYAWTRHAQLGGPRATRQQTSCGRENKCCDERLCHNRSPPPAPIRRHPPRQIKPSLTNLQSLGRPAPEVSAPKLKLPAISSSDWLVRRAARRPMRSRGHFLAVTLIRPEAPY